MECVACIVRERHIQDLRIQLTRAHETNRELTKTIQQLIASITNQGLKAPQPPQLQQTQSPTTAMLHSNSNNNNLRIPHHLVPARTGPSSPTTNTAPQQSQVTQFSRNKTLPSQIPSPRPEIPCLPVAQSPQPGCSTNLQYMSRNVELTQSIHEAPTAMPTPASQTDSPDSEPETDSEPEIPEFADELLTEGIPEIARPPLAKLTITGLGGGKGKGKGKGKTWGTQCVLCGSFYTSKNTLRHFKIKHSNYMNGRFRDHPEYPRLFFFKTIAPRNRCPTPNKPPKKCIKGVKGVDLKFVGCTLENSSDESSS